MAKAGWIEICHSEPMKGAKNLENDGFLSICAKIPRSFAARNTNGIPLRYDILLFFRAYP